MASIRTHESPLVPIDPLIESLVAIVLTWGVNRFPAFTQCWGEVIQVTHSPVSGAKQSSASSNTDDMILVFPRRCGTSPLAASDTDLRRRSSSLPGHTARTKCLRGGKRETRTLEQVATTVRPRQGPRPQADNAGDPRTDNKNSKREEWKKEGKERRGEYI